MHGVKFSIGYNNDRACTKFISFINKSIFDESIKSKVTWSNFIALLCDGSTDSAVIGGKKHLGFVCGSTCFSQHCHFFIWKTYQVKLLMTFWRLLKVLLVFTTCTNFCKKMIFIASDGVSINCGLKGGIAAKLREEEELSWLSIIWCLLHRPELTISDTLYDHLSPIKQCLCNLFY